MAARILTIDIETSPATGLWFGSTYKAFIREVIEPSRMICFAAKWLDDRKPIFASEWGDGHYEMVQQAHELLDEADGVITYNGKGFDHPYLNTEFALFKMAPPSSAVEIDLYRAVKRRFRFQSNKLDYVAHQLGLGQKLKHEGLDLWLKVLAGDEQAQRKMQRYNIQDVKLTEKLYLETLPWIPPNLHPNLNLYRIGEGCVRCPAGDDQIQSRGTAPTSTGQYPRFQCQACGSWMKGKKAEFIADLRGVA
jgi:DNA polymerase elongation subunit (family B)